MGKKEKRCTVLFKKCSPNGPQLFIQRKYLPLLKLASISSKSSCDAFDLERYSQLRHYAAQDIPMQYVNHVEANDPYHQPLNYSNPRACVQKEP